METMERHQTEIKEQSKKKVKISFKITRSFAVDVLSSDTIGSIKEKICLIEGASVDQQELFFDGNRMEDYKTVADYIPSTASTIDVQVERRMQISIKIPSMEKTSTLTVKYEDTVHKLKDMIQDEVGISLEQQLLVFQGKSLKDDHVLISCGVRKDSTIYVMLNPLAELLLYVQMSSGDTFSLEAIAGYTIKDIKIIIESLKGISASRQKIIHDEVELQDSFNLSLCKIQHKSVIHLKVPMQVFVELPSGKTKTMSVEGSDTIALFKANIVGKGGIKNETFRLEYAGKVLMEHNTLSFYGIQSESTVTLSLV